jgi:hypothetical protein
VIGRAAANPQRNYNSDKGRSAQDQRGGETGRKRVVAQEDDREDAEGDAGKCNHDENDEDRTERAAKSFEIMAHPASIRAHTLVNGCRRC